MTSTGSSTGERGATFADVIMSEFGFLVARGFQPVIQSDDEVAYEAHNGVFVRLFRDRRDGYLGFRVGLSSRPRDAVTTSEFARLTGAESQAEYPETISQVRAGAARLAQLLQDYGVRVLAGDETILDEAMALRREYTKSFARPQPPDESAGKES